MPLPIYTTVCTKKVLIARGVYELRYTKPAGFTFLPGQFILSDVPLVGGPLPARPSSHSGQAAPPSPQGGGGELFQARALSIASTPEENELLFVVKLREGGRMSRWIEEVLTEGSSVNFKGPFGNFTLKADDGTKNLLFIATGAGVAPFRPMVMEAAAKHPGRRIDVLFGVRSEEDLFWNGPHPQPLSPRERGAGSASKTTLAFAHDLPNVFVHFALSQASPSWTGHRGRVQAVAPQVVGNEFAGMSLYVCGNPDMTTDVKRLALEEWGVDKKDLHVEGYI